MTGQSKFQAVEIVSDHADVTASVAQGSAGRFAELLRRYSGATADAIIAVLCPLVIPIETLDKTITKVPGGPYRATFTVRVTEENRVVLQRGRTGKFVPASYAGGGVWREIAKGRILEIEDLAGIARGEVYCGMGGSRAELETALQLLNATDALEIDQFGAAAKVLSGLAEYYLTEVALASGYGVTRMPEDMAQHMGGGYANYDFEFTKLGRHMKVEVKSIWGTNTNCARLIHSTTTRPKGGPSTWTAEQIKNYYPTSSCKFTTQDIFAVSLFLRTGNIRDFAFARSIPRDSKPYGLPRSEKYPEHVNQNPTCHVGDGTWFATIDEVWGLD